ncbi:hypothetical protein [Tuwongella immobilis]|uniref:SMI1/KNR4 family protein n=1 Tax=Tuwongella immobilis TaxID=692036 RepID=A0A6C2YHR8_9BACT|nr:hypothetical protein [Tuwongella immobilis]VIP00801.1 Uncharacterized protein OS=Cylindrospermum stagnale PCC 7417 GN=Cylst_5903 PE=4 SV=1 [Tuwongella immobilis]VTR97020.1 Uncharacterized protein OS=Cylindrospermum stagnale PCC 7417 GN=Cylst_5903 PE=4 SV=1 [Tuwongella immobilis]
MTMDLDLLAAQLAGVPYVTIGNGPEHPSSPNLSLSAALHDYLNDYPFLRHYPDYVRFLQRYAGACINYPDGVYPRVFLNLFGIGKFSEPEGLVDEQSFYCFCHIGIDEQPSQLSETAFLFDASDSRKRVVYARLVDTAQNGIVRVVCAFPGFLEWLASVVATKGFIKIANFSDHLAES